MLIQTPSLGFVVVIVCLSICLVNWLDKLSKIYFPYTVQFQMSFLKRPSLSHTHNHSG